MEDVIVEALLSNEKEAQVLAARELGKLSSKLRQKLAERGIISPLVMMLHAQDYESIEAALVALLSLAFHSERFFCFFFFFFCHLKNLITEVEA